MIGFGPRGISPRCPRPDGAEAHHPERGKVVRERTKDTWRFWCKRELNTESNVQFGEAGAGTFGDGKALDAGKAIRSTMYRKVLESSSNAGRRRKSSMSATTSALSVW